MKKSRNKKTIAGISIITALIIIAIIIFLQKAHIGVYYAY